ncbi:hypothetical protein [Legionella sp.]|uniref:hypothetical protein n=1 Tax=Legionella sp. TaxID=459 RepID=UPI003CA275EE
MHYQLTNLDKKSGLELAKAFAAIPPGVTTLDLKANHLDKKSGLELAKAFAVIPAGVTTLDLGNNGLYKKSGTELAQAFTSISAGVTALNLSANDLGKKSGSELAQAFAAIPPGVTTLNLMGNFLGFNSGSELAQAFAAIPAGVTTLDLMMNFLGYKSGSAQAFAAIPVGVTTLDLRINNLGKKSGSELAQVFAAISGMKVVYGDHEFIKKYDINYLLDSYLKERTAMTNSSGITKEYFYGSFFSTYQKSFTEKRTAVIALKSALNGDNVNLSEHLSTLRNGKLGKELRTLIKSGMGNALVGKEVTTVSDFVQVLQEKNSNAARQGRRSAESGSPR